MSAILDPKAWVARAEEDYRLAQSALRRKRPLLYGACFHAQQCAEKYLKALLVLRERDFPKTHDLTALVALCEEVGIIVPVHPDDLDRLSAYAVGVRYPGEEPLPEEARAAVQIAGKVRRFARRLLGLK
ncbi:MAG: HEPN domain-containing protein [Thermoflexales bacterium]|nr:HEPN domain-containing protein [Thermoflexales bacterium]